MSDTTFYKGPRTLIASDLSMYKDRDDGIREYYCLEEVVVDTKKSDDGKSMIIGSMQVRLIAIQKKDMWKFNLISKEANYPMVRAKLSEELETLNYKQEAGKLEDFYNDEV